MNKLEQAAREVVRQHSMECLSDKAIAALREALAEQAEPCRHRIADARNPVVKSGYVCIDCGALFSAADHFAEQAEQEPVAIDGLARACNLAGIDYKDFLRIKAYLPIAAPVRQAEQEPVAWIKLNEDGVYIEDVTGFPVYAAPVQQVDLTDDEIERALDAAKVPELPDGYKSVDLEIARAVIAADREKNK